MCADVYYASVFQLWKKVWKKLSFVERSGSVNKLWRMWFTRLYVCISMISTGYYMMLADVLKFYETYAAYFLVIFMIQLCSFIILLSFYCKKWIAIIRIFLR